MSSSRSRRWPRRRWRVVRDRAGVVPRQQAGAVVVSYRERVAHGAQQVGEPERLGEPAAAALFEKALGVGACDVAGDEDDASRERRRRRRQSRGKASSRRRAASSDRRSPRRTCSVSRGRGLPRRRPRDPPPTPHPRALRTTAVASARSSSTSRTDAPRTASIDGAGRSRPSPRFPRR